MTRLTRRYARWLLGLAVAAAAVPTGFTLWWFGINWWAGPSSQYRNPRVPVAVTLPDGRRAVHVGDRVRVHYEVKRHRWNGNCTVHVWRFLEHASGPTPGRRWLVDEAVIEFIGKDETLHPSWPLAGLLLTEEFLPAGASEVEIDLYVEARYTCNKVDEYVPRYLQGGPVPNQSARARVVLRRSRS